MELRGSWRKAPDGTYRGVICDENNVVIWRCNHQHANREYDSTRNWGREQDLRKAAAQSCGSDAAHQMRHGLPVTGRRGRLDRDVEVVA